MLAGTAALVTGVSISAFNKPTKTYQIKSTDTEQTLSAPAFDGTYSFVYTHYGKNGRPGNSIWHMSSYSKCIQMRARVLINKSLGIDIPAKDVKCVAGKL